jgi:RNA polymerase-binding protein DksA
MVARESAAKKSAPAKKSTKRAASADGTADAAGTREEERPGRGAAEEPAEKSGGRRVTRKPAAQKSTGEKSAERKTGAKPRKTQRTQKAKKSSSGKTASPAGAAAQQTAAPSEGAAQTTGADAVAAKKTAVAKAEKVPTARAVASASAEPGQLPVRPGEDPWTPEEVEEARSELRGEAQRLRQEIVASGEALDGLMRDSGDGAGDDDADTGTKNITREHEMALAANAREMLYQTERALERLDAGTYGLCENCGKPIGKARMQAFPRATLCVECKQKQERR